MIYLNGAVAAIATANAGPIGDLLLAENDDFLVAENDDYLEQE